jgi:hypothetical protein
LRAFLAELPSSPYAAHAAERLREAESRVDPRELEVSTAGMDTRLVAHALGPVVGALESCLPAQRLVRVPLEIAGGRLRAVPAYPAADCLNVALFHMHTLALATVRAGTVTVPLAGRRAAASPP